MCQLLQNHLWHYFLFYYYYLLFHQMNYSCCYLRHCFCLLPAIKTPILSIILYFAFFFNSIFFRVIFIKCEMYIFLKNMKYYYCFLFKTKLLFCWIIINYNFFILFFLINKLKIKINNFFLFVASSYFYLVSILVLYKVTNEKTLTFLISIYFKKKRNCRFGRWHFCD